jgi:hypothetical protein
MLNFQIVCLNQNWIDFVIGWLVFSGSMGLKKGL